MTELKEFIRKSDQKVVTEFDLDPLCTKASEYFRPNEDEFSPITLLEKPAFDPLRQYVEKGDVAQLSGVWVRQWKVVDLSPEQIAANVAAALKAKRESLIVNPWPIRDALNTLGWRNDVEAAVAAGDQKTKDAWLHAKDFKRLDPLVIGLGVVLGKTDVEIDELFELAMTL